MANATEAVKWSTFKTAYWPGGAVSLQAYNGRYVTAMPDGKLCAELLKPNIWAEFQVEQGTREGTIALRTGAGKYLQVWQNGSISADADTITETGSFTKTVLDDGSTAFKTSSDKYLTVLLGHSYRMTVVAKSVEVSDWESFHMVHDDALSNGIALRCAYGDYLTAKEDGSVVVKDEEIEPSDAFVVIENDDGTIALRTTHNTYLTAQKDGGVTASATEIGLMERWTLVNNPDDTIALKGCHDKYLGAIWAPIWKRPEQPPFWDTAVVTYAGESMMAYIDSAVMLGLSLQQYLPNEPRVCLVSEDMTEENRDLLEGAGWKLLEVENWHANQNSSSPSMTGLNKRFWDSFAKINVFRVNVGLALWLDADTLVYSDELKDVFKTPLQEGQIGMVKDCCSGERWGLYNSGVMLLKPSHGVFHDLKAAMASSQDYDALDQKAINEKFDGRVVELDNKFNAHKKYKDEHSCDDAVVGHFTGPWKPSDANVTLLSDSRIGTAAQYGWDCADYYRDYYCRLKEHSDDLSSELQDALGQLGSCIEGAAPDDAPVSGFR